jgi:hypothetical protein
MKIFRYSFANITWKFLPLYRWVSSATIFNNWLSSINRLSFINLNYLKFIFFKEIRIGKQFSELRCLIFIFFKFDIFFIIVSCGLIIWCDNMASILKSSVYLILFMRVRIDSLSLFILLWRQIFFIFLNRW